ncbi:LysR family transcriptional regulator [Curvibacter sp. CHRR-16]|nr:LysR family transcriptional regulator [Curvibacter sp. CHRR-16]
MRNDLQLDWLRAFITVVDAGSLSAAAPKLYRSQSAVSMQLKKLEDAIGKPVLLRGPRSLSLTATGTDLVAYARQMLELHEQTLDALHGVQLQGQIRLGIPDDYAAAYITPVLGAFAGRYPGVEIELLCQQSTELLPKVKEGSLDLAIVTLDDKQAGVHLLDESLVWVGSPQHAIWRKNPLPIAAYEQGCMARKKALASLVKHRIPYKLVYQSPSVVGQLAAVESGLAVAVLVRSCVPAHLHILGEEHGLPALGSVRVGVVRSQASKGKQAVTAMHKLIVGMLRSGH